MPHPYLSFSDSKNYDGKVLRTSDRTSDGNGLTNPLISYVEIPSIFENVKVVEIGYRAPCCLNIVGVFIPKTIQFIGYDAFWNSQHLQEVRFEKGSQLKKLNRDIFQSCVSLKNVDIPPSVNEILGDSVDYLFKGTGAVECFSYLGSTDFSTTYIFYNSPKIHVSDSLYPAGKQFGRQTAIRDGKTCGISNEPFFKCKCNVSILIRNHYPNLLTIILLFMVSS